MQRRKIFADFTLVLAREQVKLVVPPGIAKQGAVRQQLGQYVGETRAVFCRYVLPK
jgi:hypothetical protein